MERNYVIVTLCIATCFIIRGPLDDDILFFKMFFYYLIRYRVYVVLV